MNGVRTICIELHYLIELDGGFVFKRHIDHDQLGKCEIHHINVSFKFHNDKPLQRMNIEDLALNTNHFPTWSQKIYQQDCKKNQESLIRFPVPRIPQYLKEYVHKMSGRIIVLWTSYYIQSHQEMLDTLKKSCLNNHCWSARCFKNN